MSAAPKPASAQFPRGRPNSRATGDVLRARRTRDLLRGVLAGAEDGLEFCPLTGATTTIVGPAEWGLGVNGCGPGDTPGSQLSPSSAKWAQPLRDTDVSAGPIEPPALSQVAE